MLSFGTVSPFGQAEDESLQTRAKHEGKDGKDGVMCSLRG